MKLRRLIKRSKIRIDMEYLSVLDRLICCSLFLFFLFSLENIDEAHRAAFLGRWGHLSIDCFLIDPACSAPRRLDVAQVSLLRFINHVTPVERHFFSYRSFRSLVIHRCFDCRCFYLRLLKLNIRVCSENRLLRSDDPGSAFAAELSAIHEFASTICTEHFLPPYSLLPFLAVLAFFAHQNVPVHKYSVKYYYIFVNISMI